MKETMYGQELEALKHVTRAEIEEAVAKGEAKRRREKMTLEHTPLKASGIDVAVAYRRAYELRDKRGILVAYAQSPDDAKSIVRAVNNHAKLLAALEAFEHFPCQGDDCTTYPAGLCPGCHARAAIEEAKKS